MKLVVNLIFLIIESFFDKLGLSARITCLVNPIARIKRSQNPHTKYQFCHDFSDNPSPPVGAFMGTLTESLISSQKALKTKKMRLHATLSRTDRLPPGSNLVRGSFEKEVFKALLKHCSVIAPNNKLRA